jgi:hypothetical protein
MECGGVWFAGSKFGLTWRAKQIAVHKLPEKIGDFAFKGLSSAPPPEEKDMDDVFAPAASTSAAFASAASASVVAAFMPQAQAPVAPVAVAEEDEEDGEDMEPVPPPKPVIKKKMVVGKK